MRDNDAYAWTGHYAANRAYTADGLNRYSTAGSASFAYDANGNLTSDGTRTYTYDIENRLVASGALSLTYDPLGRLHQTSGGASGTTRYLYDGDALVEEYSGANMLLRRYVHGAGADVPLVWYEGGNIRRYLHADHQGSIVAVGQAYAAPYAINRYDEYGIPAATNMGRFQYTGQIWLNELGMYHYKARVYSPTLGRFLQTDPVGYDDQVNLYAYVGNDPVNLTDPSGETGCGSHTQHDSAACSGTTHQDRIEFAELQGGQAARPAPRPPAPNARAVPGGVRGQATPGGHIRNRHVGQNARTLQRRLQSNNRLSAASTFRSEAVANRTLARAIRNNQEEINTWVESGSPFPLEITYTSQTPIGTVLYRGQSTPRNAHTATFVLRPTPNNIWLARDHAYYVHTGYVE